jgi:fatty-acyl-CoA synthase
MIGLETYLDKAVTHSGELTVISPSGTERMSWADVHEVALRGAAWLSARGVGSGSTVLLMGRTSLDLVIAIRSVWLAGGAVLVAPLPTTNRSEGAVASRLGRIAESIEPSLVIGAPSLLTSVPASWECPMVSLGAFREGCDSCRATDDVQNSSELPAIIQLTSGTTGDARVLRIGRSHLVANCLAIRKGLEISPTNDTFLSWLPLSHDMGLIGKVALPMLTGSDLVISDPSMYTSDPGNWLKWCGEYRATITAGPSFSYSLASHLLTHRSDYDLSSVKAWINGSEQIDVGDYEKFLSRGERCGIDQRAAFPVYGLAEATLAVTFPALGSGFKSETIEETSLELGAAVTTKEQGPHTRQIAVVGRPVDGMEVAIAGADRQPASSEGSSIGEILIRGESVAVSDPDRDDGWVGTGDLGYLRDGELAVCGRSKDVIIVGGRNIYPAEIERRVAALDPAIRRCAAIGLTTGQREGMGLVVELEDPAKRNGFEGEIGRVSRDGWDLSPTGVVFVKPGSIPRTTSGKVARSRCRELFFG